MVEDPTARMMCSLVDCRALKRRDYPRLLGILPNFGSNATNCIG
jgi:hypothetical protein